MTVEVEVVKDVKELKDIIEAGGIFIWNGKAPLHEALEEALKDIKKTTTKMNLRGCENKKFDNGVIIYKGEEIVKEFRQIIEIKDLLEKIDNNFYFVVKGNQIKDVMELIQQLVYLGKNIPVFMEDDLKYQKVYANLRKHKELLKSKLESLKQLIEKKISENVVAYESDKQMIKDMKKDLVESLTGALDELPRIDREIKVAVIATKKSGKSMVVNCILKEEYAPTSQELPTPNIITFIPSNDGKLSLKYKGKSQNFESVKELHEYILKEFKSVQDEGKSLDDMEIYYPSKSGDKFYVLDTPGPDLAKSEHDMIDKVLNFEPDIVVFVIDYTKHATDSEINLFERVRSSFKEKGLDMVVCIVNKIDTMFSDTGVEESKLRVAAYINNKFKKIGYDSIVVIPTSALTSFYAYKLEEKIGGEIKETENIIKFLNQKEIKELTSEKPFITYRMHVKHFAEHVFGDEGEDGVATLQQVLEFAGIDLFMSYLYSIVSMKAEAKRAKETASNIESYLNSVRNTIENIGLEDFRKKAHLLKKQLSNLKQRVGDNLGDLRKLDDKIKDLINEIEEEIKDELEKIIKKLQRNMHLRIKSFLNEKKEEILEDLKDLKKGKLDRYDFEDKWRDIKIPKEELFDIDFLKVFIDSEISARNIILEEEVEKTNKKIEGIHSKLNQELESFQREVNRNYGINLDIRLPQIELSIDFGQITDLIEEDLVKLITELDDISIDSIHFAEGIKGGIDKFLEHHLFGKDRYDTNLFKKHIEKSFKDFADEWKDAVKQSLEESHEQILKNISKQLKRIGAENRRKVDIYIREIEKILDSLNRFAELDATSCEKVSLLFNEIFNDESYKVLIKTWDEVVNPISSRKKEG